MRPARAILGFWMTGVIVCAFVFPVVPTPDRWFEFPVIPGLAEKARILFFHVPLAWTSVVAFGMSLVWAIGFLKTGNPDHDIRSSSAAGLGLLFCGLTTLTGMIWAKFSWGSFWNWDPRQTSIAVLLLMYAAYFALRSAVRDDRQKATLSAAYAVIAGVTMPFLVFVLPRIVAGLHPDPIINTRGEVRMNPTMLAVFLASLGGFTGLYYWMYTLKIRLARVEARLPAGAAA